MIKGSVPLIWNQSSPLIRLGGQEAKPVRF